MHAKLRLALYSDQQDPGNTAMDERMMRLIGKARPRIGYVPSAPDPERIWFRRKVDFYAGLGADLALYLDPDGSDFPEACARLLECDAIHLSGGNTFAFLRWLQEKNLPPGLQTYAREGGVLIGESAGAILMTPRVDAAALCGDAADPRLTNTAALGLVPFHFWPHHDAEAALTPEQEAVIRDCSDLYACSDGTGLIVDGGAIESFGPVRRLR